MPHRLQGLADHNEADFLPMLEDDLDALVALLGDKPFVTGELRAVYPSSVFRFVAQTVADSAIY